MSGMTCTITSGAGLPSIRTTPLAGVSSNFPFADDYMGPSANSELETQAITSLYLSLPNPVAAIDFHAFSQLILRPYGWTTKPCPHEKAHYVHYRRLIFRKSVNLCIMQLKRTLERIMYPNHQ